MHFVTSFLKMKLRINRSTEGEDVCELLFYVFSACRTISHRSYRLSKTVFLDLKKPTKETLKKGKAHSKINKLIISVLHRKM